MLTTIFSIEFSHESKRKDISGSQYISINDPYQTHILLNKIRFAIKTLILSDRGQRLEIYHHGRVQVIQF